MDEKSSIGPGSIHIQLITFIYVTQEAQPITIYAFIRKNIDEYTVKWQTWSFIALS